MTKALYMEDSYLKECEATVEKVTDDKFIILDQTIFYPNSGGQPNDTGKIIKDGEEFIVDSVKKFGPDISHEIDHPGLKDGDKVKCVIDWDRRYKLMRNHTAAHIISAVIHKEAGALITGNQLNIDQSRIDFSLENFDKDKLIEYIQKSNEIINQDIPINIITMQRSEVEQDPSLIKLAKGLPPGIKEIRLVDIEGVDKQPDGGTHVKSTKEVGEMVFVKAKNQGKSNRRVYFSLKD
jgi:misacylated tRNA(Ala) deacylase